MAYSTVADIKKLVPEDVLIGLTDDEGLGVVNEARVNESIAEADAEMDGWLGTRYSVPLAAPVPEMARKLSADIAVYNLMSRRVQEMPALRADRYKAAIRMLEAMARGTVTLGIASSPEPAVEPSGAETNASAGRIVFTRTKMEGF